MSVSVSPSGWRACARSSLVLRKHSAQAGVLKQHAALVVVQVLEELGDEDQPQRVVAAAPRVLVQPRAGAPATGVSFQPSSTTRKQPPGPRPRAHRQVPGDAPRAGALHLGIRCARRSSGSARGISRSGAPAMSNSVSGSRARTVVASIGDVLERAALACRAQGARSATPRVLAISASSPACPARSASASSEQRLARPLAGAGAAFIDGADRGRSSASSSRR